MTAVKAKPASKPVAAVVEAQKRASIPKRQVIEHTKLLRAELQVQLRAANDALAAADRALSVATDERDQTLTSNRRAYEAADEMAAQRFYAIRGEVDADREDILTSIAGIEAALKATEPKAAPAASNVVTITSSEAA